MAKEDHQKRPFGGELLSKFIRIVIRFLVAILIWPIYLPRVEGCREEPSEGGCLLFANHHSFFDPIFITFYFRSRRLCFIAKKELYNARIIGRILKAFGAISLDRSASDLQAGKFILSELNNKKIVGLFPQGTRVSLDDLTSPEPHDGLIYYAIRRGIPIIPVGVDPRYRLFGRPRFVFADSVILKLRDGERLNPTEQGMVANEVMRRIYALVGLEYARKDRAEIEELFRQKIEVVPLTSHANNQKKKRNTP
ncbi:MAG TPA: 1-acyl-sn-glycerol-3-phosphate acyltransferase [Clostridiaceae bacterium]|nr:1-acyl-sn-glycerol-3-phosphate acyltransferase [Clostridiaceae bacterium]